jgi:hypothetical protein
VYVITRVQLDHLERVVAVEWQTWDAVAGRCSSDPEVVPAPQVLAHVKSHSARALRTSSSGADEPGPLISYFEDEDGQQWLRAVAADGGWSLADLPRIE